MDEDFSVGPIDEGIVRADDITRRWLLGGAGAAGLAAMAAACTGTADTTAQPTTMVPGTLDLPAGESALGAGSFSLFSQDDLNFQALLALGGANLNAAVGEVITVVDQANAATGGAGYQSLYDAMVAMGNQLEEQATDAANKGHRVTAGARFMRAAQYYNQALYWVLGTSTPGPKPRSTGPWMTPSPKQPSAWTFLARRSRSPTRAPRCRPGSSGRPTPTLDVPRSSSTTAAMVSSST